MVKLTYAWWNANKAKTLIKEPLSKELKAIVADQKNYSSKPKRIEFVTPLLEKLPRVIQAIEKTEKKCSPVLHKKTKSNLGELKKEATELRKELQTKCSAYKRTGDRVKLARRKLLVLIATLQRLAGSDAIEKDRKLEVIQTAQTLLEAMNSTVGHAPVRDKQTTLTVNKYVSGLLGNCKDLKKALDKGKKADELTALRADIKKNITRLMSVPMD